MFPEAGEMVNEGVEPEPVHVNCVRHSPGELIPSCTSAYTPLSSYMVNELSAPGNTSTCIAAGLSMELFVQDCMGMMAPALANTGMRSRARQTSMVRPSLPEAR